MILSLRVFRTPNNPTQNPTNDGEWAIPQNRVLDGGVGRDGIPSIDNPNFTKASEVTFLGNQDLVLGIRSGGEVKAYPHPILDWHEIVNDEVGDIKLAVTYCPLTGTGIGWNRVINGETSEFGVSGLLFNTNLMPYDRETGSIWSQQRLDCVNGPLIGQQAENYSLVEMSWGTWKRAYPDSDVLNLSTGFSRDYSRYPYNDYRTNDERLLFPIDNRDDRLPLKERVLGVVIGDEQKAYPFEDSTTDIEVFSDVVDDVDLVIARSTIDNFIVAFETNGKSGFEALQNDLPKIMRDADGNVYDLLGESKTTEDLKLPIQFIGYWFSWGTFYPDIEIF